MLFRSLVNRAQNLENAQVIYKNMAQVASQNLDVALDFMGAIPQDPGVIEAALGFSAAVDAAPFEDASRRFSEQASAMLRWSATQGDASRLDSFMQRAIYGSRLMAAGAGA